MLDDCEAARLRYTRRYPHDRRGGPAATRRLSIAADGGRRAGYTSSHLLVQSGDLALRAIVRRAPPAPRSESALSGALPGPSVSMVTYPFSTVKALRDEASRGRRGDPR